MDRACENCRFCIYVHPKCGKEEPYCERHGKLIGDTLLCSEWEMVKVPKPITNADKIRSMTDEELAYLLGDTGTITPQWCMEHDPCPSLNDDPVPCWKCALGWLRQEASDG